MTSVWLAVLLSLAPVSELRGGIPVALAAGLTPLSAFLVCVLVNILVAPLFYLFLEFIHFRFLHTRTYHSGFDLVMNRTRRRAEPVIKKYGVAGLIFLVAVPLPGTGVYTATLAAWFFGMKRRSAFLAVVLGTVAAGIIVLSASVGGMRLFGSI